MTSLQERKRSMLNRLEELNRRLQTIDNELESHNSSDWEELALEREADEVLESIGLSGQAEIKVIQAALARLENGDYGICATCGAPISQERLNVLPYTPFCHDCAQSHENSP